MTAPSCGPSFGWMTNHAGQNPCVVAGILYEPCNGAAAFNVLPLNNSHYTPGDASHLPTSCSCSWAIYNLLQACAACQPGGSDEDITTWASWVTGCSTGNTTDLLTDDTWWPPAYRLPSGTEVQHWAIQNPNSWTNGRFDLAAAESIASQNIADSQTASGPQPTSPGSGGSSHSTPIGAIIGGVLGGLALITLVGFLVWYARYKNRKGRFPEIPLRSTMMNGNGSFHRPSDSYSKPTPTSGAIVVGHDFGPPSGQLGMTLMGNNGRTMVHHAHNHSGDSTIPTSPPTHSRQISGESVQQSTVAHHGRNFSSESGAVEDRITPFFVPNTSPGATQEYPDTPAGRKAREAARERERDMAPSPSSASASQSNSRRMNPPTYESSLVASPGSVGRPPHSRTISNDSSADVSSISASNYPTPTTLDNGASVVGGGGPQSPAAASSAAYPPGLSAGGRLTLHSVSESGDEHRDRDEYFGPSAWRGDRKE